VANIQKGWLSQVSVQAQATYQNKVVAWPDEMQPMMSGMGINMEGLKKDLYRVGIDVQQTIYDGGVHRGRVSQHQCFPRRSAAVLELSGNASNHTLQLDHHRCQGCQLLYLWVGGEAMS